LGYAELYLALSAIVRRFTLKLYETDYSDIEAVCDASTYSLCFRCSDGY